MRKFVFAISVSTLLASSACKPRNESTTKEDVEISYEEYASGSDAPRDPRDRRYIKANLAEISEAFSKHGVLSNGLEVLIEMSEAHDLDPVKLSRIREALKEPSTIQVLSQLKAIIDQFKRQRPMDRIYVRQGEFDVHWFSAFKRDQFNYPTSQNLTEFHIYLCMTSDCTWSESKSFSQMLARQLRMIVAVWPAAKGMGGQRHLYDSYVVHDMDTERFNKFVELLPAVEKQRRNLEKGQDSELRFNYIDQKSKQTFGNDFTRSTITLVEPDLKSLELFSQGKLVFN